MRSTEGPEPKPPASFPRARDDPKTSAGRLFQFSIRTRLPLVAEVSVRAAPLAQPSKLVSLTWPIAQCLAFTEQRVANIAARNYHPRKSSSVPVLSVTLYVNRPSIDQLAQPFLGFESQHELALAAAVKALRRVDVDQPDRLALVL